jgi:hypothetical protein
MQVFFIDDITQQGIFALNCKEQRSEEGGKEGRKKEGRSNGR